MSLGLSDRIIYETVRNGKRESNHHLAEMKLL
jgi:hypothetical protein